MELFLVALTEPLPDKELDEIVNGLQGTSIKVTTANLVLLASPHSSAEHISTAFGFTGESNPERTGVVFKLNGSYFGYYYSSLWNWLRKARETNV